MPWLTFLSLRLTIPESFGKCPGCISYLARSLPQPTFRETPIIFRYVRPHYHWFIGHKLEGDPSIFFNARKSTKVFHFSNNLFQFDLSRVKFPKRLTSLDLPHNKIPESCRRCWLLWLCSTWKWATIVRAERFRWVASCRASIPSTIFTNVAYAVLHSNAAMTVEPGGNFPAHRLGL